MALFLDTNVFLYAAGCDSCVRHERDSQHVQRGGSGGVLPSACYSATCQAWIAG